MAGMLIHYYYLFLLSKRIKPRGCGTLTDFIIIICYYYYYSYYQNYYPKTIIITIVIVNISTFIIIITGTIIFLIATEGPTLTNHKFASSDISFPQLIYILILC